MCERVLNVDSHAFHILFPSSIFRVEYILQIFLDRIIIIANFFFYTTNIFKFSVRVMAYINFFFVYLEWEDEKRPVSWYFVMANFIFVLVQNSLMLISRRNSEVWKSSIKRWKLK